MGGSVETRGRTPLLDLAVPLSTSRSEELLSRTQEVVCIAAVAAAAAATLILMRLPVNTHIGAWIERAFGNSLSVSEPFEPLLILIAAFAVVAIHELGHFLMGLAVGFRLHSMRIGPIALVRETGRWRLTGPRNMMDGLTAMEIVRIPRLHRRMFAYIAGGPGSGFLVSLLCLVPMFAAKPGPGWLGLALASLAFFSLLVSVTNLMPHTSRGVLNDGARLRMLLRSREETRRWFAINALLMQASAGIRPRNWNRRWLGCATAIQDRSVDALSANWLAYVAWSDENNAANAAIHLERCLELIMLAAPDVRELLILEAAIFTAWFRGDAARSEEWLKLVRHPRYLPPLMRIRAEVALDCAHRDFNRAVAKWRRGQDLIQQLPEGRVQSSSSHLWSEWLEEIRTRQQTLSGGVMSSL